MKTVVDKSEVAHLWANKRQDTAKNAGHNFYFSGDTIYSYGSHFPIAKHYENVVLFTLRGYSNTTAKHIRETESAASHLPKVYCYYIPYSKQDNDAHQKNLNTWVRDIESSVNALKTARKREKYFNAIEYTIKQAEEYIKLFKLKLTKEQKNAFVIRSTDEYTEQAEKRKKAEELFRKQIQTKGKKLHDDFLAEWKAWNEVEFKKLLTDRQKELLRQYESLLDRNTTYLRFLLGNVYTSKGIELPVAVAQRYYRWWRAISKKGGCKDCNYEILGYSVLEANETHLVVGCHDISAQEINELAAKLNW